MGNRSKRAQTAKETLSICESGQYTNSNGEVVELKSSIEQSIADAKVYSPETLDSVRGEVDAMLQALEFETSIEVRNATTFATASEMLRADSSRPVLCLNFASAKNPGGGFLGGSQAQEEALCRASALYVTINPQQEYYEVNRNCGTCLYTDYMIYSPSVPVFRNDRDELLDRPFEVSVITAPAVNKGALANSQPEKLQSVETVMRQRIEKLLSIAVLHGYERLVLGAWGCGVFRNNPADIASLFREVLTDRFSGAFEEAGFGVLDFSEDKATFNAFAEELTSSTFT